MRPGAPPLPAQTSYLATGVVSAIQGAPPWSDVAEPAAVASVECVTDAERFRQLRGEWSELLEASDAANPFLTWEWLHTWWVHLSQGTSLHLVLVREGERLIAVAPLHVVTSAVCWSRLEFLGTGYAGSDYLDVIVRRGHEVQAFDALADYLDAHRLAVRFDRLPPASFAARLAQRIAGDSWDIMSREDGRCPLIPLAGHTFDSYLGTLGSSHRANVRRRIRGLGQQFDVRFDLIADDRERCQMLAVLADFHEARYKERGGSSAFMTPAVRAFQDEATRLALAAGWLRMYVLRLDGRAAAVMYGFCHGGRFYFYQHGFDEQYHTHSLGLVLMAFTVRAAIEDGAREFDMLWGEEPYKFLWARGANTLRRVELFPVDLAGTLHRHTLEARRNVGRLVRRVMSPLSPRVGHA